MFPPSLCHVLVFGAFNVPPAPGGLCGPAVVGVVGGGCVWFCRPCNRHPRGMRDGGGGIALSGVRWMLPLGLCLWCVGLG